MKISVYWITRKRIGELSYSIASFLQSAFNPKLIEIIVCYDEDDMETEYFLRTINRVVERISGNPILIVKSKRHGYEYIDRYHNQIAKVFTGDCLISTNDDMFCNTTGWDEILVSSIKEYVDVPLAIWPVCETNHGGHPRIFGINKNWYERTQHLSGWRCADDWMRELANKAQITIVRPELELIHLRQTEDENYKEGRGAQKTWKRGGKEDDVSGDFERDVEKLIAKQWWEKNE